MAKEIQSTPSIPTDPNVANEGRRPRQALGQADGGHARHTANGGGSELAREAEASQRTKPAGPAADDARDTRPGYASMPEVESASQQKLTSGYGQREDRENPATAIGREKGPREAHERPHGAPDRPATDPASKK